MPKRKRVPEEAIIGSALEIAATEQPTEKARRLSDWLPSNSTFPTDQEKDSQQGQENLSLSPPTSHSTIDRSNAVKFGRNRSEVRQSNNRDSVRDLATETKAETQSKRDQEHPPTKPIGQERRSVCDFEENARSYSKRKRRRADSVPQSVDQHTEPSATGNGIERAVVEEARDDIHDPITWWVRHKTWPSNFATFKGMASSGSSHKRPRVSGGSQSDSKVRKSYSQSRKDSDAPTQYTSDYDAYILRRGLNMDLAAGKDLLAPDTEAVCASLLKIERTQIGFTLLPQDKISHLLYRCNNRNEDMVRREVTPLIVPSIHILRLLGFDNVENIVDEVNTNWYGHCVIAGPRPRPDLAVGIAATEFSQFEIGKLNSYATPHNLAQFTSEMYFPFLMCEVKRGSEGLNQADRQNMHSCSVAVKAILDLQRMAGKQKPEQTVKNLSGRTLVFSISHNDQDARLYGHFAKMVGEDETQWTYHRHPIRKFDLTGDGLLGIHNFALNLLNSYVPSFVQRLKDCINALPDASGLSFAASEVALEDEVQDSPSVTTPVEGGSFITPGEPASVSTRRLMEQMLERQRKESGEREDKLLQQLEQQRKKHEEDMERLMTMVSAVQEARKQS